MLMRRVICLHVNGNLLYDVALAPILLQDCHSKSNPRMTSGQESRSLMENPTAIQLFKSKVRKVTLSTFSYSFNRLTTWV